MNNSQIDKNIKQLTAKEGIANKNQAFIDHTHQNPQRKQPNYAEIADIDNFMDLATKFEKVYVDKSSFIKQVLGRYDKSPILIITRPKGWGKTTNLTMLKQFIEAKVDKQGNILRNKPNYHLFAGGLMKIKRQIVQKPEQQPIDLLKKPTIFDFIMKSEQIHKQPNIKTKIIVQEYQLRPLLQICRPLKNGNREFYCQKDFGIHPVILVDFGKIKGNNFDDIKDQVLNLILEAYKDHSYLNKTRMQPQYRIIYKHILQIIKAPEKMSFNPLDILFVNLIDILQDYYQQSCYLLVDNYDEPLLRILKNENIVQIRKMAALIASLFSDFQIKNYIPPSDPRIQQQKLKILKSKKCSSTRAILFGKTNIFTAYLSCFQHFGVGDPNLYSEFGLSEQELSNQLLQRLLQQLKLQGKTQLKSQSGYNIIKKQLSNTMKAWYGGYTQHNQNKLGIIQKRYSLGNIWKYLKQYIADGIIGEGKSFYEDKNIFDQQWYLKKFISYLNINQILQFQLPNPVQTSLMISDFLAAGETNSSLSENQLIHIGYSFGYITGFFSVQTQKAIHLTQSRFPNLQVAAKCKTIITNKLQPYLCVTSQKDAQSFDLMDRPTFKEILQKIINKISIGQHRDIFQNQKYNNALIRGIIYYRLLAQKNSGYVTAASIENQNSLQIDTIFMKTKKQSQTQSKNFYDRAIIIDVRHSDTTDQRQVNNIFLYALREIYENPSNMKRLGYMLQKQKNIAVNECFAIIRVAVITYDIRQSNYQLIFLEDNKHTHTQLMRLKYFFENYGKKWHRAYFGSIKKYRLSYRQMLQNIDLICKGQSEKIIENIKYISEKQKLHFGKEVSRNAQFSNKYADFSDLDQFKPPKDQRQSQSGSFFTYNYSTSNHYRYQNKYPYQLEDDQSEDSFKATPSLNSQKLIYQPEIKKGPLIKDHQNLMPQKSSKSRNILINYSSAFDKKSFYYYDNNSGWDNNDGSAYRTRKFNYPVLDQEDKGESNSGQMQKRLYGRKQFKYE